jgi:hypothetical protein
MITGDSITKKQARKILKLIERETRCEVMARLGRFDNLEYIDYATQQIEYKDRLRKYIFGTSSLGELGDMWGLLKRRRRKRK